MKRKKIKTIICHMAIITICMGVFCHGYIKGFSLSKYDRIHSYAEADNWSSCDTSDLVTAFRYYCKSRNLALEGSVADALTSFTTTTFNNICSTLGIDPTQLQAELKKTTDGNLGLRFLFTNNGITAYNRIFAEFLQNNDLSVGDTADDQVIYSGDTIDGHFIYVINTLDSGPTNPILKYGTDFYDGLNLYNNAPQTFTFYGRTATTEVTNYDGYGYRGRYCRFYNAVYYSSVESNGGLCLARVTSDSNRIYPCAYVIWKANKSGSDYTYGTTMYDFNAIGNYLTDTDPTPTDITVNTPGDTTINNNTYNYNYTIIYNDGDHYGTDSDDEPGSDTPPPGGGGGGDPGSDPDNWDPTTPTIPNPSSPSFPTVNLPDIDIPDLPSLNFSLGDLRNKFPFSLPFDIIAVLNVLDGEPQAPHIEATVPIGRWYTWEMDFDFSEFDNYARIFRGFEFIGFCIGLAVFTVHFVKG